MRDNLLGAQSDLDRFLGRQGQGFVHRIGVQRLGAAQHSRQRLQSHPHDIVLRLLRRERTARRLGMEPTQPTAFVLGAVFIFHSPGHNAPRGAVLGYLLKEITVGIKEVRQPRRKLIDILPRLDSRLNILEPVGQCESQLLHGGGTRLANMITADRDCIPLWHMLGAVLHHIRDQADGRPRWEYELLLGDVLFENIVLQRATHLLKRYALFFCDAEIKGQRHRGRGIDRHRR